MKTIYLVLLLPLCFCGCTKKESAPKATSSNSDFDKLYNGIVTTNAFKDEVLADYVVHAYTFEVANPHTITKIGYQSLPNFNAPYLFEIFDSTAAVLVYSGYHAFSPNATTYVAIKPVVVVPGHSYTLSRIQDNFKPGDDISEALGRALHPNWAAGFNADIVFPKTSGDLTITGSVFYGDGNPSYNHGLPYIDLIYN